MGEVRLMQICAAIEILQPLLQPFATAKWQVFALLVIVIGPVLLKLALFATIKSKLVGSHEQGLVQGVLAAVTVLAQAVADAGFGWFYRWCTDSGKAPNRSSAYPPHFLVAALLLLALTIA